MKLLILGNARHGKDTLAELFQEHFGLTFMSSSQASADFFLYDQLKDKYGYNSPEECFNDRVNHRDEWYLAICDYNKDNRARLATDILSKTDCYVGMRDKAEFDECVKQILKDSHEERVANIKNLKEYMIKFDNKDVWIDKIRTAILG